MSPPASRTAVSHASGRAIGSIEDGAGAEASGSDDGSVLVMFMLTRLLLCQRPRVVLR
jgi:hypothetical protein